MASNSFQLKNFCFIYPSLCLGVFYLAGNTMKAGTICFFCVASIYPSAQHSAQHEAGVHKHFLGNEFFKQPVLRINSFLLSFNDNYYYQLSNYRICPKKVLFNLSQPPFTLGIIELKELWGYVVQSPHYHPQWLVKRPSPLLPEFQTSFSKLLVPSYAKLRYQDRSDTEFPSFNKFYSQKIPDPTKMPCKIFLYYSYSQPLLERKLRGL